MKEFVCAHDYYPLLPDAEYIAQCFKYEKGFAFGKAKKLYLKFRIIEGKFEGTELFMAFNMPYGKKLTPGYKYYKTWVKANGFQKPSRNAIMSPRFFKNKICKIKTRTSKPEGMPQDFWYSVVDKIVGVMAG